MSGGAEIYLTMEALGLYTPRFATWSVDTGYLACPETPHGDPTGDEKIWSLLSGLWVLGLWG